MPKLIVTVFGFAIPGVLVWLVRFSFYLIGVRLLLRAIAIVTMFPEFVQSGFFLAIFHKD